MVTTGQEMVRGKKKFQGQGKVEEISVWVRENLNVWKKSRENEILRVHIYSFPSTLIVFLYLKFFSTFYGHESCCSVVHCGLLLLLIYYSKLNNKLYQGTINSYSLYVTCWKYK